MDTDEVNELTDRLQRVERRVFIMGAGWLLSIVMLVVLWIGTQHASSQTPVLKARSLTLVDQSDRTRLFFGISDQGNPGVWLYDENGKTRIHLGIDFARAPEIVFSDENGNERLRLGLADAQARSMFVKNPSQVWLAADPGGPPRLSFYSGTQERLGLGVNGRGDQGIWVFDASGKVIWSAPHGLFGGVRP